MAELKTKILLRNDTKKAWETANPVLGKGEVGIEIDTKMMKLGDGSSEWMSLPYFKGDIDLTDLSADNVYFTSDITLAGDYASVGNVKLNKGTLSAANKTVSQVFEEIFTKELPPSKVEPSVSFKITSGTSFEAGTTVTPEWESTFSSGSYTYKSTQQQQPIKPVAGTGVAISSWDIAKDNAIISHSQNGSGSPFVINDSNVVLKTTANYNAGNYALTNLNKLPSTEVRIAAGSKSASQTIYTYRKEFAGGTTSSATIDSPMIRKLSKSRAWSTNAFEFQAAVGDTKLIFAFPKSKSTNTPKFEYFTMSWEGFSGFVKSTDVSVADVRGGENGKVTYTVYTYTPAVPFKAVTKFRVMM